MTDIVILYGVKLTEEDEQDGIGVSMLIPSSGRACFSERKGWKEMLQARMKEHQVRLITLLRKMIQ